MLLEFSCSNHKSIRNKILFSALASPDTTFIDRTIEFNSYRILKSSVIYGANGSGKSNFIDAIEFMKMLVTNSINHQPGHGIRQTPHKLENYNTDSKYSMQFVTNGIRYAYGFTINNLLVKEEYLYYFPNQRSAKIFERNGNEFTTGSKFRNKFSMCKEVLKPNRLLLSCAANFSSVPEIESVFRFFDNDIVIYNINSHRNWLEYSMKAINDNDNLKSVVISLMNDLGVNISDIRVKIDNQKLQSDNIIPPDFLTDDFRNQLAHGMIKKVSAKMVYKDFETDLMSEESTGIKKLLSFLCPFIGILINDKILICDELETSLHESLLHELLDIVFHLDEENMSQLFFTTHDTSLLDLELFRRDQIWFTELKNADRSTDLYSLSEIKNIRKDENISRGYIRGKYGAIPMLNIDFANIIEKLQDEVK